MPVTRKKSSVQSVALQFMAFNHNYTPLCRPTTEKAAIKELAAYVAVTCNNGYVDEVMPCGLVTRGGIQINMAVFS